MNNFISDRKNGNLQYGLLLFVLLILSPMVGWAQDLGGCYYIKNNGDATYYLCPSPSSCGLEYATGQPYLTTYKTGDATGSVWYFMSETVDNDKYYYIVHLSEVKYMTFNEQMGSGGSSPYNFPEARLRIHLQTTPDGSQDQKSLFKVYNSGSDYYTISPKSDLENSLNPAGNNYNDYCGTDNKKIYLYSTGQSTNVGGLIGIYDNTDNRSKWKLTATGPTQPTISYNHPNVTISHATSTTFKYTTDGRDPFLYGSTINGTTNNGGASYEASIGITSPCTIKAVALSADGVCSKVATYNLEQVATPALSVISNRIYITCATTGASIYYTTDGNDPDPTNSSQLYNNEPLTCSGTTIKAIAVKAGMVNSVIFEGSETLTCDLPIISKTPSNTFTIVSNFPSGVKINYTWGANPDDPTTSSGTLYDGPVPFDPDYLPFTVKAIAYADGYDPSDVATQLITADLQQDSDGFYIISSSNDFISFVMMVNGDSPDDNYKIINDINVPADAVEITVPFTGELKGIANANGLYPVLSGQTHAIFNTVNGGKVHDIMLKSVTISGIGNVGAICNEATGASRIYNCGILPTTITYDANGVITDTGSTLAASNTGYCGSLVGQLSGNARVINCFSYAFITGGAVVAGIVGYNATSEITQDNVSTVGMVVNCMFYGDITGGTTIHPVYGGSMIKNDRDDNKGVNPYDYFRKSATFDDNYNPEDGTDIYNRSWPAEEKNLVRFEYYRSVLNSNRRLCTWWVNGTSETVPTDADVENVGIAKWVLDKTIAPYPILKKWGKYPSIINIDPNYVYDPSTHTNKLRANAKEWEGKSFGTLPVTILGGAQNSSASDSRNLVITDMDTLNYDYCAYKVQLPYYNEIFGDPNEPESNYSARYANNYTDYVVTGWMVTAVSTDGTVEYNDFVADWENGYNFADRKCKNKDLYNTSAGGSGRVFAQGGYYYVPEGVTGITITAKWGKALYLSNRGYSIDRVKVAVGGRDHYKDDKPFNPAGTINDTFHGQTVYNDLQLAIKALGTSANYPTVYDQAIVLIGNHQVKNGSNRVDKGLDSKWHPFTIMSADLDFDNEPDYCLQLQFRDHTDRPAIQPVRFDFLPVVELGLAVRPNSRAYAIGIMVPQGHFEITETSFMRTTQFEYYASIEKFEDKSPVIINGGEFELFNVRYKPNNVNVVNRTSYFLLGGHAWVHRFAPGPHPNNGNPVPQIALCAVNAIGGEYPEFYLSGINRADNTSPDNQNPHCYTNGGKFDMMAGAGYEEVKGNVTFKINRSLIKEFYGGGINGAKPVKGNIDVVIDNSKVTKYCGGPQVGEMDGEGSTRKTVTTSATGTVFTHYFGGGNGGNSYYRDMQDDGDWSSTLIGDWNMRNYHWSQFSPLRVYMDGTNNTENRGYHEEYEPEVFNQSNGVADEVTMRGYIHWIQFGTTITGNVTNTLNGCTVEKNFYGGGNLGNVDGTVTSILTDCTVLGDVFGAGFSADTATFHVQNKEASGTFPTIDKAGTITPGTVHYVMDGDVIRSYKWTNDLHGMTESQRKAHPEFEINGKWYCYTWNSLAGLGSVSGNVTLTLQGATVVGTEGDDTTGRVFGGGDASAVSGNTSVILKGRTDVQGNVYGGGNEGFVGGNSQVIIQDDSGTGTEP